MSWLERFLSGFFIIFKGFKLISQNRGLLRWSLVPFLIGLIILVLGVFLTFAFLPDTIRWLIAQKLQLSPEKSGYFFYPLVAIVGFLLIILNVYLSYWLTRILGSPVYSILAEQTLKLLPDQSLQAKTGASIMVKMFFTSIVKAIFFSSFGVILFLTTLIIPGLNVIVSVFLFFVIASDTADYGLEILGLSFKERLLFYRMHAPEFFGLAMCIALTLVIPGLILLIMPAAVVGSSAFVYRRVEVRVK